MASKDLLGDRLKAYEAIETARRLDITLPIYARIDGRGFSRFTRGLRRPYDERLSRAMIDTTKYLLDQSDALISFTQSDEISIGWSLDLETNPRREMFFGGKVQKLVSVLASMATAAFTRAILQSDDAEFAAYANKLPQFDCRVLNLPSNDELANAFLWRELDASRNAVSMLARHHFSHTELQGKTTKKMLVMLADKGVDFDALPTFFRRGTFVRRESVVCELSADIPGIWLPVDATLTRSKIVEMEMPRFIDVENRVEVVLGGTPRARVL